MISPANLCIDQLLRAAQLLEQQQQNAAAAAALQLSLIGHQGQTIQFCKLGGKPKHKPRQLTFFPKKSNLRIQPNSNSQNKNTIRLTTLALNFHRLSSPLYRSFFL
jgi:hypothetical protein